MSLLPIICLELAQVNTFARKLFFLNLYFLPSVDFLMAVASCCQMVLKYLVNFLNCFWYGGGVVKSG